MTTYRVQRRTRDFTQIQNATIRDDRLSFRARGVLAWLLSHVDTWEVSREQIARNGTEGVGAIRTAQTELTAAGYLERVRVRQDDGTFKWVTNVYETPGGTSGQESTSGEPADGSATSGELQDIEDHLPKDDVKDHLQNLCSSVDERTSLELVRVPLDPPVELSTFAYFWDRYSRKVGKKEAEKAWGKMSPDQRDRASTVIGFHVAMWEREGRGTRTIPHAATWLNGERWDDELEHVPERATITRDNGVGALQRRRQAQRQP